MKWPTLLLILTLLVTAPAAPVAQAEPGATSEVVVSPGRIESWDRGFDAEGVQVWGAEKGAYVFLLAKPEAE
jgi:hypothetical protein